MSVMSLSTTSSVSSAQDEPFLSMTQSKRSNSFSMHFPHTIHAPDVEKERGILRIFQEISSKYGFQISTFCHNEVVQLTNPETGLSTRVIGHSFDINSAAAQECCKDRTATYRLLRAAGIPVIESETFFKNDPQAMERIYAYAWPLQNIVLCTPADTSNDIYVTLVKNREELDKVIHYLFQHFQALYLSPCYPISCEYRVIMLNTSAQLAVKTIKPETETDEEYTKIIGFRRVTSHSPNSSPLGISPQDFEINQVISIATAATKALGIAFCSIKIAQIETGELKIKNINPEVTIDDFMQQDIEETGYRTAQLTYEKVICQLLEKPVTPELNAVHPLMSSAALCHIFSGPPLLDLEAIKSVGPEGFYDDPEFEIPRPVAPIPIARKEQEK